MTLVLRRALGQDDAWLRGHAGRCRLRTFRRLEAAFWFHFGHDCQLSSFNRTVKPGGEPTEALQHHAAILGRPSGFGLSSGMLLCFRPSAAAGAEALQRVLPVPPLWRAPPAFLRCQHHHHEPVFHPRNCSTTQISSVSAYDAVELSYAELLMRHFTTAETQR